MGQKVNPNGFRVGVIRDWNTHWYAAKKDFADFLIEDRKIRDFVKKTYYAACISRIAIDRATDKVSVTIYTARPGMLIGKGGAGQAMQRAMQKPGVKGIKLMCAGRLGGAEIARSEGYHDGSIPLQTMRADIHYGFAEAHTQYGRIGIKVWIYKGEVLKKAKRMEGGK